MTKLQEKWTPPNHDSKLHLPLLQPSKTPNIETTCKADIFLSVNVDETFINAWHHPPKEPESPQELQDNLSILMTSFNKLIVKGQSVMTITEKAGPNDVVTEIDQGIEMLFRLWIHMHYPNHKIIGEEGYKDHLSPEDVIWFIDPIDGTKNFTDMRQEVTVHFGSIHKGKPFVSIVGLPFQNTFIAHNISQSINQNIPSPPSPFIIGTEYMPHRTFETDIYTAITQAASAKKQIFRAIGSNLVELYHGRTHVFYKIGSKYWDVLAPLCLLYLAQKDSWDIKLYIPRPGKKSSADTVIPVSPFSCDPLLINRFNDKHKKNYRIGLIVITHKSLSHLHPLIVNEALKNDH